MKKLISIVCLMLLMVSATEKKETMKPSIEGTWELVSNNTYDGDGNISETIMANADYRQIKMFYNGKIMWTRYVPNDSKEWFGYGSYQVNDANTELKEKLEFMSASMRAIAKKDMVWTMELVLDKNTFSQISIDEEGNRINSENYKRID